MYKAKVKEISPSDPKKVFAFVKVFEGTYVFMHVCMAITFLLPYQFTAVK